LRVAVGIICNDLYVSCNAALRGIELQAGNRESLTGVKRDEANRVVKSAARNEVATAARNSRFQFPIRGDNDDS